MILGSCFDIGAVSSRYTLVSLLSILLGTLDDIAWPEVGPSARSRNYRYRS